MNVTDATIKHGWVFCKVRGIVVYFVQTNFHFKRADLEGKLKTVSEKLKHP